MRAVSLPSSLRAAIDEKIFPLGIVLRRGNAVFRDVSEHEFNAAAAIGGAGFRNVLLDEADRGPFEKHAGEFAVGVVFEFAAFGIGRVLFDAGLLERERICDGDVAGDVNEEDGVFRTDGVELLTRGEFLVGPERVIPARSR